MKRIFFITAILILFATCQESQKVKDPLTENGEVKDLARVAGSHSAPGLQVAREPQPAGGPEEGRWPADAYGSPGGEVIDEKL